MLTEKDNLIEFVDDYLHGALSEGDAAVVERFCEQNRLGQAALDEARRRHDAMRALPPVEAPERLIRGTLESVAVYDVRTRRVRRIAPRLFALVTAAAATIIGLFHWHYGTLEPTPWDLQVFGQTRLLAGAPASLRIRVAHAGTSQPAAGVSGTVELRGVLKGGPVDGIIQLASFKTDTHGTAETHFDLPDWPDGSYELVVQAGESGVGADVISRSVELTRSWKLMLSTDKPIYQPGQTILMRSLALRRPDLKPVADQPVTFSLVDPKGNVLFKHSAQTSRFGIASAECPLATETSEGAYELRCVVGDTESLATVEVQKYVLPKFKLQIELDQAFYQPGATIQGTIQADYFFGRPVADAAVQIVGQTTDVEPVNFQELEVRTDSEGRAEFEIKLPDALVGREQDSGDARVTLGFFVVDSAGQKQAKAVSRVVTAQPIKIEVIPESGTLVPGVANRVFFFTSYADGRPAKTQVRIAAEGVADAAATNDAGVAAIEITPATTELGMTLFAADAEGREGRRHVRLAAGQQGRDFLVRLDKAAYEGGDTMSLLVLGGGSDPLFLDLLQDGQTILTTTVPMSNGRGEHQIDIPPTLGGTIELCAYRFDVSGLAVRKTQVVYVRPAGGVMLSAQADRDEYRPGDKAQVRLKLTDAEGNPAPGAISLAAVDEAVYAVVAQRPGLEKTFFTLEQELLEPVYAIYAWDPFATDDRPVAERELLEQALFARTVQVFASPEIVFTPDGIQTVPAGFTADGESPHTLVANSRAAKVGRITEARENGLARSRWSWVAFGIGFFLLGLVTLIVVGRYILAALIAGGTVLVGLAVGAVFAALVYFTYANAHEGARADTAVFAARDMAPGESEMPPPNAMPLDAVDDSASMDPGPAAAFAEPIRVRSFFPETLLWRPELITDDRGEAVLDIEQLADSITTWRLTASAVTAEGKLGSLESGLKVFQPFFVDLNLPVALTRGDEVAVPVVVYNYLDRPQTVELALADAAWFARLDEPTRTLDLASGEVRSTSFRLRVDAVGTHELEVAARGGETADAIRRRIEVVPDGRLVEFVTNGTLTGPQEIELVVPEDAIPGSVRAIAKIYPSAFSQVVEGLDAIFQMPYGCFEQTSSTTYPNVMALDYLRKNKKNLPAVEATAKQYIHLGYQRLVTFEVAGGGFDWFGNPPASLILTAYGLMEFADMAKVHDVDPALIARTRSWLLAKHEADGSWTPDGRELHEDPTRFGAAPGENLVQLNTTAYVAWAVFRDQPSVGGAETARDYLLSHEPQTIRGPYTLALVANALLALDPTGRSAKPYLDQLDAIKRTSDDRKLTWWEEAPDAQTAFFGAGQSGNIEATALAALAFIQAKDNPAVSKGALGWLIQQKDPTGAWHSTQATVLALKALLAGSGESLGDEQAREIELAFGGEPQSLTIPVDQSDVVQRIDLTPKLRTGGQTLRLNESTATGSIYQVALSYHVPDEPLSTERPEVIEPLSIDLVYDRDEIAVNDSVEVTATVTNNLQGSAPMVILDLPVPGGFMLEPAALDALVAEGQIAKYQLTPRKGIVYLRSLEPGRPLVLKYRLRATMPVKVQVPSARAYHYYDPAKEAISPTARLVATEA